MTSNGILNHRQVLPCQIDMNVTLPYIFMQYIVFKIKGTICFTGCGIAVWGVS